MRFFLGELLTMTLHEEVLNSCIFKSLKKLKFAKGTSRKEK